MRRVKRILAITVITIAGAAVPVTLGASAASASVTPHTFYHI